MPVSLCRFLSRFLLVLMVLAWVAPTALQAGQAPMAAGWMEVCTPNGIERHALPGQEGEADWPFWASDHCPLCLVQGGVPPAALPDFPSPFMAGRDVPATWLDAARPGDHAHALFDSRAPPAFSAFV